MSLDTLKISPGFESYMPKEYVDLVERGPYGRDVKVSEMGTFTSQSANLRPSACERGSISPLGKPRSFFNRRSREGVRKTMSP